MRVTRARALVEQGNSITVPQYREHGPEELRSRAAMVRRMEERAARKAQSLPGPESSSSSEDSDDATFARTHGLMEEQERAMYAGWTGESCAVALFE